MSDNGKLLKTLIQVNLVNGEMKIKLAVDVNRALLSHALLLLNIEITNMEIEHQLKKMEKSAIIQPISERMKGFKLYG